MSHSIEVIPAPKMDAAGLYAWTCSCGRTSQMIGTRRQAEKAGADHAVAMEAKDARQHDVL